MAKAKEAAAESAESNNKSDPKKGGGGEVHAFQAEMQQLLNIIIHSMYSEREIFLRELISNASDALNKIKFQMITDSGVRDKGAALEIELEADEENKTLTVSDTGIGMTREELISNLGTIAKSGTLEFVKQLSSADPTQRMDLIGQFGVGFYSVFMVAKRVVVDSCPANPKEKAWQWSSDGGGEFEMAPSQRKARGTSIRVEFKEEGWEFCAPSRIEHVRESVLAWNSHSVLKCLYSSNQMGNVGSRG